MAGEGVVPLLDEGRLRSRVDGEFGVAADSQAPVLAYDDVWWARDKLHRAFYFYFLISLRLALPGSTTDPREERGRAHSPEAHHPPYYANP